MTPPSVPPSVPQRLADAGCGTSSHFLINLLITDSDTFFTIHLSDRTADTYTKWQFASKALDGVAPEERTRILDARKYLDFRVNVFFKQETKTSTLISCYPGEEYELKKRHHAISNTPNVGQTTFHLFEALSTKEKSARKARRRRIARWSSDEEDDDDMDDDDDDDDGDRGDAIVPGLFAPARVPSTPSLYIPPTLPSTFVPIHLRYPAPSPPNMVGRIPLVAEVQYSGFGDWGPRTTLLAANSVYLPEPCPKRPAVVFLDGYWGQNEFTLYPQHYDRHAPWLAYIVIDDPRLRQPLHHEHRQYVWTDGFRGDHTKSAVPHILEEFADTRRQFGDELKWVGQRVLQNRNLLNRDVTESDLPFRLIQDALNAWGNLVSGEH